MAGKCCPTGQLNCGGTCIDPLSNPNNCGSCGKTCSGRCSQGICCGPNQSACGGQCYNTSSDPKHCGSSCTPCTLNLICVNGSCVL